MRTRSPLAALGSIAAALVLTTCSADGSGVIEVVDSWAPSTPPGAPVAAIYLTIANGTGEDDRLTAVTSDRCGAIELHATQFEDGIMRMRLADPDLLVVPAREQLEMVPGDLHVMCIDFSEPFKDGDQLQLTVTLESAGELAVTTPVENR